MTNAHFDYETKLWHAGRRYVAGIDEVGRGPLAGPVVACAVILRPNTSLLFPVRDSKKLTVKRREELDQHLRQTVIAFGIGEVSALEIDQVGIKPSAEKAMIQAVQKLSIAPEHLLIDFFTLSTYPEQIQTGILGGDAICASIAAASIIAKVYRDQLMVGLDTKYPQYGFAKHKGYGTKYHLDAIRLHGPCPLHRRSFLRNLV